MSIAIRLHGFWRLVHPGPSLATAVAYAICALLASNGHPPFLPFILSVLGMVSMQFAISSFNDYRDREADAHSTKPKPIVQGIISPQAAVLTTCVLTLVMYLCYLPLGLAPTATASAFLLLGFAYDLGVKQTPFSGFMHGLAFPTIPLLAWQIFSRPFPALYWAFPIILLLGVGIHLADAIPDAQADLAAGVRGLTQLLGPAALAVCWGLFALADLLVIVLASGHIVPVITARLVVTVAMAVLALAGAVVVWRSHLASKLRLRYHFLALLLAAVFTAGGWLAATVV